MHVKDVFGSIGILYSHTYLFMHEHLNEWMSKVMGIYLTRQWCLLSTLSCGNNILFLTTWQFKGFKETSGSRGYYLSTN